MKATRGFTIVELLIVIVVIAILAAITIVAYNGIQTRAENSKTFAAVTSWAKALQMYKTDNGDYPAINSCLGDTTTYTDSYSSRCWAPYTSGWTVQSSFLTAMRPYVPTPPVPSNKDVNGNDVTNQYRGALFWYVSSSDVRIYVNVFGITSSYTNCPNISGLGVANGGASRANGYTCYYSLQ